MIRRFICLAGAGLLLASCSALGPFGQCPGYGACTGKAIASPYDQGDYYTDSQGHVTPGMSNMRYGDMTIQD